MRNQVANFLGVHFPEFVQCEVPLLEFLQDFEPHSGMLPQGCLKVPNLPLDRLGQLEDPAGEQGPVLPKDDLEEGPGDPGGVGDDVVLVGDQRESVHFPSRYVGLDQDVDLKRRNCKCLHMQN